MEVNIAQDLRTQLNNNQRTIFLTDADDLLATWRFKKQSSTKRSKNLSMVPTKWRLSAPPHEKSTLKPCHVAIRPKAGQTHSSVDVGSTIDCHGHGMAKQISIRDLDTLQAIGFAKQNVAPYVSPILDSGTLALVCKDLGLGGRAIPKVIDGRQYIAFVQTTGSRTIFPRTIFSVKNSKVIKMGIGALGIKNMAARGGILTIYLTVSLTILEAFLADHVTGYDLMGELAADVIKIGVPALIGAIAGLVAGEIFTLAALPILITIGISLIAGVVFTALDENYRLAEKMTEIFEAMGEQIKQDAKNKIHDVETGLYNSMRAFFVKQGVRIGPF